MRPLVLVLAGLLALPLAAQERVELRETLSAGLRRTSDTRFQASLDLESSSEGAGVFQRERRTFDGTERRHELHAVVDEKGRSRRFVRTYEVLHGRTETTVQATLGGGPEKSEWEGNDDRAGKVLDLEVDGKGDVRVLAVVPEASLVDFRSVLLPHDHRLLPDRPVAVGGTWSIPGDRVVTPWVALAGTGMEGGAKPGESLGGLTGRLDSLDEEGVASISFQGKVTFQVEWKTESAVLQRTRTIATYEGTLRFDARAGRSLELSMKATLEREEVRPSNYTTRGKGSLEETRAWRYATIVEDQPDNGEDGPASVDEVWTSPHSRVDEAHIVVLRGPAQGPRLVVFDPAARKIVKTIAVFPKQIIVTHPALAPGRDRLAFVSNLNNGISHATTNVFVLDLPSGRVDQLTPDWASGKGLARPFTAERTGRIVGRITWKDERGVVRTDVTTSTVRADGTANGSVVGSGGAFVLEGMPVRPLLVQIRATGIRAGGGMVQLQAHVSAVFGAGDVADCGTVALSWPWVDRAYDYPTWRGGGLLGRAFGLGRVFECDYPERRYDESRRIEDLSDEVGSHGPIASPDGKWLASYLDAVFLVHDAGTGERLRYLGVPDIDLIRFARAYPWPGQSGVWLPDSDVAIYAGYEAVPSLTWPAIVGLKSSTSQILVPKTWPEAALAGRRMVSVATDPGADVAYVVVHTPKPGDASTVFGDLYAWDSRIDATTRLTNLGDVIDVANTGR